MRWTIAALAICSPAAARLEMLCLGDSIYSTWRSDGSTYDGMWAKSLVSERPMLDWHSSAGLCDMGTTHCLLYAGCDHVDYVGGDRYYPTPDLLDPSDLGTVDTATVSASGICCYGDDHPRHHQHVPGMPSEEPQYRGEGLPGGLTIHTGLGRIRHEPGNLQGLMRGPGRYCHRRKAVSRHPPPLPHADYARRAEELYRTAHLLSDHQRAGFGLRVRGALLLMPPACGAE